MLIGREKEQYILRQALQADRSRFVAVYGKRRVGKTFLKNQEIYSSDNDYHI